MKIKKMIKSIFGFIALFFAFIGIWLPIWPTTPFILIAIGCFSTMPSIQKKLLRIPIIREYYDGYYHKQGLKMQTLISSLMILWVTLWISFVCIEMIWLKGVLIFIGLLVSVHLIYIARIKPFWVLKKEPYSK